MAVVPNVILRQVRQGQSVWKVVASGHAGRAGVFAALLARAGMEGPHLPFEGKAGWCDHVARERFTLDKLGGKDEPFRLLETQIKHRPALSETISSVLAAERITPRCNPASVRRVKIEVYARAKEACGTDPQLWTPATRTKADHSIPYVIAATLIDGTVTPRSYNDAHLKDPRLQGLIKTVEVVENTEFTLAYKQKHEHHTRVTVELDNGEKRIGISGGGADDLSAPKTDAEIEAKFRMLTEDVMSVRRVDDALRQLWKLEEIPNVAVIPALFAL
jgi:2-methylcitrate dehydratase